MPKYRKPFSACLGTPIAPLSTPFYEGTGGLYLKIGNDIVLLTCAHVVRPPPAFPANLGMQHVNSNQLKEYIVAPGDDGYKRSVNNLMEQIAESMHDISTLKAQLKLPNIPNGRRTEMELPPFFSDNGDSALACSKPIVCSSPDLDYVGTMYSAVSMNTSRLQEHTYLGLCF